jgi:putative Holliday junction resolvase
MKIMALDYGDARTGVALSDLTGSIVGQTAVLPSRREDRLLEVLEALVRDNEVGEVVMGYPRNMNGTEGPRAELYRAFAEKLSARLGMEVRLWDERRTTVEAHQILSEHNSHGKKRKNTVDAVAASLILEGYLAFRNRS